MQPRWRRGGAVVALALLFGLAFVAAPAASAEEEGWSYEMWSELMSPFCPGRSLSDCPSGQADQLRAWIVDQEREGRDRPGVEDELIAKYGETILSAPRARGFGAAAYWIPVLAFVLGGGAVAWFLRRQGTSSPGASGPARAVAAARPGDRELERLLDEEIGAS